MGNITSKYYAKHGSTRIWTYIYRNRDLTTKNSLDIETFNEMVKDEKLDIERDMVEVPAEDLDKYYHKKRGYFLYSKNEYSNLRKEMKESAEKREVWSRLPELAINCFDNIISKENKFPELVDELFNCTSKNFNYEKD